MTNEQEKVKLAQLLKVAMEQLNDPINLERMKFLAITAYRQYIAYTDSGFSPEQAMSLVIAKL